MLLVKKVSDNAKIPSKAYDTDAGWDLYASEDQLVLPNQPTPVKLDIQLAIPPGYYGRVAPRSGTAKSWGIDVLAGVIDSGYRGDMVVILHHTSGRPFRVNKGDKVAQLVVTKIAEFGIQEVKDLPSADRGANGFGSSGK